MSNDDVLEQQMTALHEEIQEKRQKMVELLRQKINNESVDNYELKSAKGSVKLSELFGDRGDLIVIHNMGKDCPYCTLWADGFNGLVDHIQSRAALVMVSPDSPDVQREFAQGRNWNFEMISGEGSTFIEDMGFKYEGEDGKSWWMPGLSTFRKQPDGTIKRIGMDMFGPGDFYNGVWHMFDLLDEGANGWQPKYSY